MSLPLFLTYMILTGRSVRYLGLQVVSVLVVEPDLGVVAVAQAVGGDPVLLVAPALGHDSRH